MQRTSFVHQPRPLIVSVIRARTVAEVIAAIRNSQYDGAQGFDLHLSYLEEDARTPEVLRRIIAAADGLPVLALYYNVGFPGYAPVPDEDRAACLVRAIEAGASAIDMQGSLFDANACTGFHDPDGVIPQETPFVAANPHEVTFDPAAIEAQRALIARVHALGGEVLMSVHTQVPMSAAQVVSMAQALETRGIDILKMVTPSRNLDDNLACLAANVELGKNLKIPFHYHCSGAPGAMTRIVAPMFGSHLIFTNQTYTPVADENQVHLRTVADAYRGLRWRIPGTP